MWYVRDVLYAVLYVRVSCFVVRGCGVSRRYIDVCYCDMFSVVNVYLDHLKFYVVCINSRMYVCCSECDVVYILFIICGIQLPVAGPKLLICSQSISSRPDALLFFKALILFSRSFIWWLY